MIFVSAVSCCKVMMRTLENIGVLDVLTKFNNHARWYFNSCMPTFLLVYGFIVDFVIRGDKG